VEKTASAGPAVPAITPGRFLRLSESDEAALGEAVGPAGELKDAVQRRVRLKELMAALEKRMTEDVRTPVLPANTRYYARQKSAEVAVVEEAPRIRTIQDAQQNRYTLAFPYVVYLFAYSNGAMEQYGSRLFYRTAPLQSLDDQLLATNLTHTVVEKGHTYRVGTVCMGAFPDRSLSLGDKAAANIQYFWEREFLLGEDAERHNVNFFAGAERFNLDERVADFRRWEKESVGNPLFALSVAWRPLDLTVRQAVAESLGKDPRKTSAPDFEELVDMVYRLKEVQ
jgi:hypothetical protein